MSVKMSGRKHPAKEIRDEIDRLRAEIDGGTEQAPQTQDATPQEDQQFSSVDDFTQDVDNQVVQQQQQQDESQVEDVKEEPQVPREQTVDYWKHRFEVVQGQQRAEAAANREQLASLKSEIERLKQQTTNTQASASVEQILDNLEDEYGQEFSQALNKRIDSVVSRKMSELDAKFESEIGNVRQVQQKNEEQLFQESIGKFVPNWIAINNDPAFINWLSTNQESFSGIDYLTILRSAYGQRDLDKVTRIFNTYTDLATKAKKPVVATEQQQMIAPPKRGSVSNTIAEHNSGKVFSQSEIHDFYRKLNNGEFKGKDEYVRQTKQAILKANTEGRII